MATPINLQAARASHEALIKRGERLAKEAESDRIIRRALLTAVGEYKDEDYREPTFEEDYLCTFVDNENK